MRRRRGRSANIVSDAGLPVESFRQSHRRCSSISKSLLPMALHLIIASSLVLIVLRPERLPFLITDILLPSKAGVNVFSTNWDADNTVKLVGSRAKLLRRTRSAFQLLEIFDHASLGTTMFIDGDLQLCSNDEFIYHEMMAHTALARALVAEPALQNVGASILIIGGGDGGICSRVLQHEWVRRVVLVDIDPLVIELAKEYFPIISNGCFNDPRTTLLVADGVKYAEIEARRASGTFDAVIIDSTDYGVSDSLRKPSFYFHVKALVRVNGVVVQNLASPHWDTLFRRSPEKPFADEPAAVNAIFKGLESTLSVPELRPADRIQILRNSFGKDHVAVFSMLAPTYAGAYAATIAYVGDKQSESAWPCKDFWPPTHAPTEGPLRPRYFSRDVFNAAWVLPPFVFEAWL